MAPSNPSQKEPKQARQSQTRGKSDYKRLPPPVLVAIITGIFLVIGNVVLGWFGLLEKRYPFQTPPAFTATPAENSTTVSTLTSNPYGKPANLDSPFPVGEKYSPSGYMGDVGDVDVSQHGNVIVCTYTTNGAGPQEWDWKYIEGELNLLPARFAGVMLLDPPGNWGVVPEGGYDLRGVKQLSFQTRSVDGEAAVEFFIGGVNWQWDKITKLKTGVPYPDSMPRISLASPILTDQFQTFTFDLSSLPADYLRKVVGALGWTISWSNNGVEANADRTGPVQPRTIIIEIKDIYLEK